MIFLITIYSGSDKISSFKKGHKIKGFSKKKKFN